MVERAMIPEPTEQMQIMEPVGRREMQAMRRNRSARLMRAREHMEIWGRWREEGTARDEVLENSFEEEQNSLILMEDFNQEDIAVIQELFDDEEENDSGIDIIF